MSLADHSLDQLPLQLVTVENRQTVLNPRELFNAIWAVWYQTLFHFGRSPWVTQKLAPPAIVHQLPNGMAPPAGAWNVIMLDSTDQEGALGYHTDENNGKIPYAEVFVGTAKNDGIDPAEVLSHEVLEMMVDPWVEGQPPRSAVDPQNNFIYIVEVGDPVQGFAYDVGEPEGRMTGVTVSDFALPAWWNLGPGAMGGPYDFRNRLAHQFEVGPQGYMSRAPASEPDNWGQIYGEHARHIPDHDGRARRLVGATR